MIDIPIHLYILYKKKKNTVLESRNNQMLFTGEISFRRFEIHSDGFTIELVHILIWHSYTCVNRTLSYVTLPVRLKYD